MILGDMQILLELAAPAPAVSGQQAPQGMPTPVTPREQQLDDNGDPAEFQPLKKYNLIQRLFYLKQKMQQSGLSSSELDTLIKFCNDLSYDTLVRLTDKIVGYLTLQYQDNVGKGSNNGNHR